jgi:signal transduction histidine kinase
LVRFDPKQGTFRHFDAGDGIGNTEFNRRSALRTRAGRFVFGGLNGLTIFDPLQIRDNPYVPPIVVTRFQKSNRSGTTTLYPPADQPLRLSYRDYSFLIEFASLSFTNPEKNRYRYRLEGFDPVWSRAGPERTVRYTNIPPATYRFRVQGSNNDGLWNEVGTSLTLVIAPPFYQTWWFRFLFAITVLGLLAAAYRYRVQRLLEMERMRLRIAGDLHDDVGSKLSGIALMSELLESEPDLSESRKSDLQEISHSAREIIDDLRDIVWFIDPDHDHAEKTVEKMHQVARSLLNGTTYSIDTRDLHGLEQADMTFRRNLFLIFKEALHNINRHANARHVSIRLDEYRGHLRLRVSDDGIGFNPADEPTGNGLKNMQRRALQMGGTLTLNSTPEDGTTVELLVKTN